MRSLTELIELDDPARPEIEAAVTAAPNPAVILAGDPQRADEELLRVQVTTPIRLDVESRRRTDDLVSHPGHVELGRLRDGLRRLARRHARGQDD
ncbi:DUF2625 family protein [Actinoplanes italicus]|uniref:DUF2625 family protein n=1 Tax=Actinoplanes italicus TaxID=113567 RepID=UPI001EF34A72|nr:DUF2625 family protein [Actinoplanes italicus]